MARLMLGGIVLLGLLLLAGCDAPVPEARGPQGAPVLSVATARVNGLTGALENLSLAEYKSALQTLTTTEQPGLQVQLLAAGQVLLVVVDLEMYQPTLVADSADSADELTARRVINHHQRAAKGAPNQQPGHLMIGSFFVAGFAPLNPLGLLQMNGRTLSPLQPHGYTRILGTQPGGLGVVHRGAFHRGQFTSAVQVGPGIIEGGDLDINPTEVALPKYLRSFVGVCGDRALLGVTFEPMHLYRLGQLLIEHLNNSATPALACDEVVNLSGDRETLLVLPSAQENSMLVYGDPDAPKSALLRFVQPHSVPSS